MLTTWETWINIVKITIHSVRKRSPAWKYSFCLLQHHFGDIYIRNFGRIDRRIARICLSIRTILVAHIVCQNKYNLIPKNRLQPYCISRANQNLIALMALDSTYLPGRSWRPTLRPVKVGSSGKQPTTEVVGESYHSLLSFGDLVRLAAKSRWSDVERTSC